MNVAMRFADAGTVRAVLDGETRKLRVLAIPFGDPNHLDRLGQYFTPRTQVAINVGDRRPVLYMHGFSPNKRMMKNPPILGSAIVTGMDKDGWWMEPEVGDDILSTRIWESAKVGKCRASTGSVNYLVRPEYSDNGKPPYGSEVEMWPVAELSLFDAGVDRVPVSDDAVVLPLRSIFNNLELEFPEAFEAGEDKDADDEAKPNPTRAEFNATRSFTMNEIEQAVAKALADQAAAAEAQKTHDAAVIAEYEKQKAAAAPAHRAVFNVNTLTGQVTPAALQRSAFRLTESDLKQGLTIDDAKEAWEQIYSLRMAGKNKNPGMWGRLSRGTDGAYRVLEESEAAEGGPMIAAQLLNRIWEKRGVLSLVRRSGMATLVSDTLTFNIPTETTAMTTTPTVAEEAVYVANEPAFTTTAVTMVKKGDMVTVTEEMLEDQNLFQSYFVRAAGKAIALAENLALYTAIATVDGVEIAVQHTPSVAEVLALYYRLTEPYRPEAVFIANDATAAYVQGLTIANPFAFASTPSAVGMGDIETLKGKRFFTNGNWTSVASAGDDVLIMSFINLSESIAWVDHSSGLKIFVDPYGDALNGRVRYFPRARFAAAVANSDGVAGMDDHA